MKAGVTRFADGVNSGYEGREREGWRWPLGFWPQKPSVRSSRNSNLDCEHLNLVYSSQSISWPKFSTSINIILQRRQFLKWSQKWNYLGISDKFQRLLKILILVNRSWKYCFQKFWVYSFPMVYIHLALLVWLIVIIFEYLLRDDYFFWLIWQHVNTLIKFPLVFLQICSFNLKDPNRLVIYKHFTL